MELTKDQLIKTKNAYEKLRDVRVAYFKFGVEFQEIREFSEIELQYKIESLYDSLCESIDILENLLFSKENKKHYEG
jgi:hypothetical protein